MAMVTAGCSRHPSAWHQGSGWGKFIFRAHRLEADIELVRREPLIGISVERQEPLALRLAQRINALPLSSRESELCLALVMGDSRPPIASRMGISEHTLLIHCRNLYAKLEVRSLAELKRRVQAG